MQISQLGMILNKRVETQLGPIFQTFFPGKISGENSAETFPLKNAGENWNFPLKKFQKIISPRNSEENSAEKNYENRPLVRKGALILFRIDINKSVCRLAPISYITETLSMSEP
jgi:hypothetical protein